MSLVEAPQQRLRRDAISDPGGRDDEDLQ